MVRPATHVIKRFPGHELAIERLARSSETFRSMCEDYVVGVEAHRRWGHATRIPRASRGGGGVACLHRCDAWRAKLMA
jgi:hypothetical protein